MALGVGFLGAGPVTQAIHLPTLATLGHRFRVARVMDVDGDLAERVAGRCGAASTTDPNAVFDDPAVDVVAVCSPNAAHAEQVLAACAAGARAVLCEKPLAVSREEADSIAAAATASGTHVIVGTMHVYDPAWCLASALWSDLGERVVLCQSSILLPGNDVMIGQATDLDAGAPAAGGTRPTVSELLRGAVLGLAIHDLPLIRSLRPTLGRLRTARYVRPFGYSMVLDQDDGVTELHALMPGGWAPDWTLRAVGETHELRVTFPPSYVLSGSCRAEIIGVGETRSFQGPVNGYQAEWVHLADVVHGEAAPIVSVEDAVTDLHYALDLADQLDEVVG